MYMDYGKKDNMTEFNGKIVNIRYETGDVKTFTLIKPSEFTFIPGQYCLVSFAENPELRGIKKPFTFSNSPTEKKYIELTIKKTGKFTEALFELIPEQRLKIEGPFGEALNFNESVKSGVVFIAGGSGITPFMSAIRYAIAKELPNRIILFLGNQNQEDIIFYNKLKEINNRYDNIQIINTISETNPEWNEEKGLITKNMIEKYVHLPLDFLWYICGPPMMNTAMKNILNEMNIPTEKIRTEPWEIPGKSR